MSTNNGWNNQIAAANSAITLNSGTNNVNVSTDAAATTVLLGTGGAAKTVTLGSTSTTSTTNLQSGSGGINIPAFTEGALITSSTGGVSTVTGTAGFVLTANAAGTAPSFQAAAGGGITTIAGDTGSATGASVNFTGTNSNVGTIRFNAAGSTVAITCNDGNDNIILGDGVFVSSGSGNTGFGHLPFGSNGGGAGITGQLNSTFGYEALYSATSASHNACFGTQPLLFLLTGQYNLAVGASQAGANYTGAESSNISLNASATTVTGESNVLRIGDGTGTGNQQLAAAFISGIFGKTVGVSGVPVVVDNADQLGTVVSSARFKENIQDMPADFSSKILDLKPSTFNYIADESKSPTWGLIAEDVQKVMPDLVVNGQDGLPIAVKYNDLPVLLLNELIKLKKEIADLKANQ